MEYLTLQQLINLHDPCYCPYESINHNDYHKMHLPRLHKMNFKKLLEVAEKANKYLGKVKVIIMHGSVLNKWHIHDVDFLIIHDGVEDAVYSVPREKPKYYHEDTGTDCSGIPVYKTYYLGGVNNPIPLDIRAISEDTVKRELEKNKSGDLSDTVCRNALLHGVIIMKEPNFDINKFGIENRTKYKVVVKKRSVHIKRK